MIFLRKLSCSVVWLIAVFAAFASAQPSEFIETKGFLNNELGGECVLKNARLSVDGQIVTKTFEIAVPEGGEYYMNAWAMGANTRKGIQSLAVYVDYQDRSIGSLEMSGTGWQCAKLGVGIDKTRLKTLSLAAGMHTISFRSEVPYVPAVEFIRLAKDEAKAAISEQRYRRYLDSLKAFVLPPNYAQLKKDSTAVKLMKVLPNPQGDYVHEIEMSFSYTYYAYVYFQAGTQVVFETRKDDPYSSDPVMEFFNAEDPINKGSWVDDNSGEGYQAKITCTVQYTGMYYLLLWSFWLGTSGTTNLYLNDNLFASNVPLTHSGARCDHSSTEVLNYYTSYLTGDSRIWIEDQDGFPGKIRGWSDDYYGSGDFYWGLNSRVKKSFSMPIRATQLSAYSSYNPTGTCDMYMKCGNSNITSWFENLKPDDAIRSAPVSGAYNCASWSGGITSYNVWPPWNWPWSDGYSTPPLTAFDNYYGNKHYNGQPYPRYSGAWNYTRSGASSSNSVVDLWAYQGGYTHCSVRKPGNDHPHGYDWESKPNGWMRTFHPRDALWGSLYGNIDKYYRWDGTIAYAIGGERLVERTGRGMTLEKSVAADLSTIEEVEFSESEKAKLAGLIQKLPEQVKREFNTKYDAWKMTWQDPAIAAHSNPEKYAESKQYEEFLGFCKKQGKAICPLLFSNFEKGSYFDFIPIRDWLYLEYRHLLDELNEQYAKPRYTDNGVYIAPSPRAFRMRYIKKLLALPDDTWGELSEPLEGRMGESSDTTPEESTLQQNYPNPFNPVTQIRYGLPSESRVSLKIYDVLGREVAALVNDEIKAAGWHTITWDSRDGDGSRVASGIYVCRLIVGENAQNLKIVLMK